jgi:hypothetical protein
MESATIREGMTVYSKDGKKLGKIVELDDDTLVVEKGLFFRKDHVADVADVDRVKDGEVWLRRSAAEIENAEKELRDLYEDEEDTEADAGEKVTASTAASGEPRSAETLFDDEDDGVVVTIEEEEVISVTPEEPPAPGRNPPVRR